MTDKEKISNLTKALFRLTLSADRYIDDGSWIDKLTSDIEFANEVLKGNKPKESKNA